MMKRMVEEIMIIKIIISATGGAGVCLVVSEYEALCTASHRVHIWVIGIRTRKKLPKCHFFLKVRSWYGRIKAKIDIILSPSILS